MSKLFGENEIEKECEKIVRHCVGEDEQHFTTFFDLTPKQIEEGQFIPSVYLVKSNFNA
jgi:hypothetical protein